MSSRTAGSATLMPCSRSASPNPAPRCRAAGRRPWPRSRRCTTSPRPSWNCCPGWSSCPSLRRCCWRTVNPWPPSSSWCRWAPRAGSLAGSRMPATPWKTRFRTVSMNWTRTRGCSSSMPRTNRASTSTCRPCAITCSHVRAVRRSPSSTCASSATTCALWPSPAACSRTRWSRGCAGAARRGACAWWCTAARAVRDRQTAAARHPSRCWASFAIACAAGWRMPASRPGAWLQRTFTTGCCDGSTRAPRCSVLGRRTGSASTRWRATRTRPRPARSSWRAGGISASGCSSGSRARTWRKGPGTSTACRTAC